MTYDFLHIIAHPDDDVIFGSAFQWKNRKAKWGVVCFTQTKDTERGKELIEFQKFMGVPSKDIYFLGFGDIPQDKIDGVCGFTYYDAKSRLMALGLSARSILTHNPAGEYGHPQHSMVSSVVLTTYRQVDVYCYAWGLRLPDMTLKGKGFYHLAHKYYPSQKGVIDLWQRRANVFDSGIYVHEVESSRFLPDE